MTLKVLKIIFLFIFSFQLYCSDIVEDISVPEKKNKSNSSVDLNSLQNFIITNEDSQDIVAVSSYPISTNKNSWDDLNKFSHNVDKKFFKNMNKKIMLGSLFCGLFGCVVPHPSCGYVIKNIGDFLHIPISSVESDLLISWLTITTTPAFFQQSFNLGKRVLLHITHNNDYTVTASSDEDSKPHLIKKSMKHYISKYCLFFSASINATIPVVLMREAEKDFPMFFSLTCVPFYIAWLENYYRIGSRNIDYLFRFYNYTAKSNNEKRQILKKKINLFRKSINKSDKLTEKIFNIISSARENDFSTNEGDPFAFSSLFLRNLARMDADEGTGLLLNFKADMDANNKEKISEQIFEWISTFLTGAGLYSRYSIHQFVLDGILKEVGFSPEVSFIASASLSAYESIYRATTTNYVQKQYFKSFLNIFKSTDNLIPVRKTFGLISFVNGSLFSLPNVVAGINVFKEYSLISKISYLAPSFLLDLSYYDYFFNSQCNEVITNISSLRTSGLSGKRSYINFYANKAYHVIDQFDSETIEKLYQIIEKGV